MDGREGQGEEAEERKEKKENTPPPLEGAGRGERVRTIAVLGSSHPSSRAWSELRPKPSRRGAVTFKPPFRPPFALPPPLSRPPLSVASPSPFPVLLFPCCPSLRLLAPLPCHPHPRTPPLRAAWRRHGGGTAVLFADRLAVSPGDWSCPGDARPHGAGHRLGLRLTRGSAAPGPPVRGGLGRWVARPAAAVRTAGRGHRGRQGRRPLAGYRPAAVARRGAARRDAANAGRRHPGAAGGADTGQPSAVACSGPPARRWCWARAEAACCCPCWCCRWSRRC